MQPRNVKWFDADEPVSAEPKVRPKPAPEPELKLLVEREPGHRIFLRNLADTFVWRLPPPAIPASRLGRFWGDVFVQSRVPWWSFVESMLWHALLIAAVCLAPHWMPRQPARQTSPFRNSYVAYYTPSKSFSAVESSRPRTRARSRKQSASAKQRATPVPREHRGIVTPPDLHQALAARPNLGASTPALPAVPLSATQRSELNVPAGPTSVVAPPPSVNQAMSGRPGLPQASVVAPPPDVAAVAARRGMSAPGAGTGVVAPAPNVPMAMRRGGDVNIGHSAVVGPAPQLPMHEQSDTSGMGRTILGNTGTSVVPPPPSVSGSGSLASGRKSSLSGAGSQVVPPPPSVEGAGIPAGQGRANTLSSAGLKVIPPAPSVEGTGNSAGRRPLGQLSGSGSQVVPPPPSVEGAGGSAGGSSTGGRRVGSLSGAGSQVVPPPPSVADVGNGTGGGRAGLSGAGSQVVPPPPSVADVGNGTGGGRAGLMSGAGSEAMAPPPPAEGAGYAGAAGRPTATNVDPITASSPPAEIDNPNGPAAQEVPLRIFRLTLALPSSSYFSNYEVFIAERRLGKDATQLIKLVYIYLPYQLRLSEYVQNNSRVYKLRVTRDPTCDESMMQMTVPQADSSNPDPQSAPIPPELSSIDRNSVLPCYRTTADDYRRALSRTR